MAFSYNGCSTAKYEIRQFETDHPHSQISLVINGVRYGQLMRAGETLVDTIKRTLSYLTRELESVHSPADVVFMSEGSEGETAVFKVQ